MEPQLLLVPVAQVFVFGRHESLLRLYLGVKDSPQALLLDLLLEVQLDLIVNQTLQIVLKLVLEADAGIKELLGVHLTFQILFALLARCHLFGHLVFG